MPNLKFKSWKLYITDHKYRIQNSRLWCKSIDYSLFQLWEVLAQAVLKLQGTACQEINRGQIEPPLQIGNLWQIYIQMDQREVPFMEGRVGNEGILGFQTNLFLSQSVTKYQILITIFGLLLYSINSAYSIKLQLLVLGHQLM